jgi:hypothetical protein
MVAKTVIHKFSEILVIFPHAYQKLSTYLLFDVCFFFLFFSQPLLQKKKKKWVSANELNFILHAFWACSSWWDT